MLRLLLRSSSSMSLPTHSSIRWAFDCSQWSITPTDWFKCLKSIYPEERERINRFVFRNDAISSMVGRLLMRKLVVEASRVRWKDVKLARSEKGKPYTPGLSGVVFNVSHHGRMTVLAAEVFHEELKRCQVSKQRQQRREEVVKEGTRSIKQDQNDPVSSVSHRTSPDLQLRIDAKSPAPQGSELQLGVDICSQDLPRNTPIPEFFRIMRRNFHSTEWDFIRAVSSEASQLARFYRLWALKESFVKATGTGISVPLGEMCFVPRSELVQGTCVYDTRVRVRDREADGWLFEETRLEGGYCVAVALFRPRGNETEEETSGGPEGNSEALRETPVVVKEKFETTRDNFEVGESSKAIQESFDGVGRTSQAFTKTCEAVRDDLGARRDNSEAVGKSSHAREECFDGVEEFSQVLRESSEPARVTSSDVKRNCVAVKGTSDSIERTPVDDGKQFCHHLDALCDRLGVDRRHFGVDKAYEVVRFEDVKEMLEDVVVESDEEVFYEAQDFVKKELRSWDR